MQCSALPDAWVKMEEMNSASMILGDTGHAGTPLLLTYGAPGGGAAWPFTAGPLYSNV